MLNLTCRLLAHTFARALDLLLSARKVDGTGFNETSVEDLSEQMARALGMDPHGRELMYMNGELMETPIFTTLAYVFVLLHKSENKLGARARGPLVAKTRSPTESRSRNGGYRIGGMEVDGFVAHGAAAVINERLFMQSDPFTCTVCKVHGIVAIPRRPDRTQLAVRAKTAMCPICGNDAHTTEMVIPYSLLNFIFTVAGDNIDVAMQF